jgi:hypothetical protein
MIISGFQLVGKNANKHQNAIAPQSVESVSTQVMQIYFKRLVENISVGGLLTKFVELSHLSVPHSTVKIDYLLLMMD